MGSILFWKVISKRIKNAEKRGMWFDHNRICTVIGENIMKLICILTTSANWKKVNSITWRCCKGMNRLRHLPHKLPTLTERSNRDLSSLDLMKADPHKPCESAKESDAKRGIQGNDLFIVLKAEILGGKLYGICRMMDVHVHGKALGARVIRALDLDGNEIAFALDDEINLRTALRFPIMSSLTTYSKPRWKKLRSVLFFMQPCEPIESIV